MLAVNLEEHVSIVEYNFIKFVCQQKFAIFIKKLDCIN